MSWKEICNRNYEVLLQLLQKYLDPLEHFEAQHYLELARALLDFYRCEKATRVKEREVESVEDTLALLSKLIRISVDSVIEKYKVSEYRAKLKKYLDEVKLDELDRLRKYMDIVGLQIVGLNLSSLILYASDPTFVKYIGSIAKMIAIMTIEVKRFWAQRVIRKFSVKIEKLARNMIREAGYYLKEAERVVTDAIENSIAQKELESLTGDVLAEEVYVNTPEVISFARRLQMLRKEFLGVHS